MRTIILCIALATTLACAADDKDASLGQDEAVLDPAAAAEKKEREQIARHKALQAEVDEMRDKLEKLQSEMDELMTSLARAATDTEREDVQAKVRALQAELDALRNRGKKRPGAPGAKTPEGDPPGPIAP